MLSSKLKRFLWVLVLSLISCKGSSSNNQWSNAATPVVVAEANQEKIEETIDTIGSILANEEVQIKNELAGAIDQILFTEGSEVTQDQVLVKLDPSKILAELAEAEANFHLAQATVQRSEALFKSKTISSQEHDQDKAAFAATKAAVELAKEKLKDTVIKAPFAGIVGSRLVSPGQVIGARALLTTLTDLVSLKAEFHIPERYAAKLASDQTIKTSVTAFPEEQFIGKVFFISPNVEATTRTVLVKALVTNNKNKLKPGMLATIKLVIGVNDQAITIPETALIIQGNTVSTYVVGSDHKVELRLIKLGQRLPGKVRVIEGISAGEKVVTEGTQKIRPGSLVAETVGTPIHATT